ncbi:L-dopachrome tautomerase yellow-f2-like, partial [Sipha flava]|uniref:L-dopachrome tautomerase yellow-f2-like n=1 Tax=Sipha flava TaxID=143950 RepID=A0A8B8GFY8_9HEMI
RDGGCRDVGDNTLPGLLLVCRRAVRQWTTKGDVRLETARLSISGPEHQTPAIESGAYVQANNMPVGLDVWNDKLFITVPRWKTGVWSTLNYVSLGKTNEPADPSPELIPYPSYKQNCLGSASADRMVSVFRVSVDACDRLWAVDTGVEDAWGRADQLQAPKLMVFDLRTDTLIRQHTFGAGDVKPDSFLANVVADASPDACGDAHAYVPDLGGSGLLVYSLATDASWRVEHHYFHFDPLAGNYRVAGHEFQWTDGVVGVALSPRAPDGSRTLYFHPLSSTTEFAVSTRVLQNATAASDSYHAYRALGTRGPGTQASGSALDEGTGVLFYTQVNRDGVGCWNSVTDADDYSPDTNTLVAQDRRTLEFPNDVKVDRAATLWVLSDRLSTFLYDGLDPNDVNFRVFS